MSDSRKEFQIMTRNTQTQGTCELCGKTVSKSGMTRHLKKCLVDSVDLKNETKNEQLFIVSVQGKWSPQYWLYLQIKARAKLSKLDDFLRHIWLECCGHLSAFNIQGQSFESSPDPYFSDDAVKGMSIQCGAILQSGMSFEHIYDFGTSTELKLKVVDEIQATSPGKTLIRLLARNELISVICSECNAPATDICSQCIWEEDMPYCFCEKHAEEHECGEEMCLPIVNSPRVGMCGYTG